MVRLNCPFQKAIMLIFEPAILEKSNMLARDINPSTLKT
jgi:hypothetical protein